MHVKNPHNEDEIWFVPIDIEHEADVKKRCIRCNQEFLERDNIGKYKCRYHNGWVRHNKVWSCCNQPYDPYRNNGCRRCDHTDYPYRDCKKLRMVNVGALKRLKIDKPLKDSVKEVLLLKNSKSNEKSHDDYVLIIKTFE
jgi:hypothetical protein